MRFSYSCTTKADENVQLTISGARTSINLLKLNRFYSIVLVLVFGFVLLLFILGEPLPVTAINGAYFIQAL